MNLTFSSLDKQTQKMVLSNQLDEINSFHIYRRLAKTVKNSHNADILSKISSDEFNHYTFWKNISQKEVKPQKFKIWFYYIILRLFGLTFGIRLMERGEKEAQELYSGLIHQFPDIEAILKDEERHEDELVDMLREDMLNYASSIVLGLSDALVELLGALAGFTFALQKSQYVALAGFITGISAALSMAASEYLSKSEEVEHENPLKAATFTGISYLFTVILLILPFLVFINFDPYIPLLLSVIFAVMVIFVFTFYISVARNLSFKKRFLRMVTISLSVAFISLIIGFLVKIGFNIEL